VAHEVAAFIDRVLVDLETAAPARSTTTTRRAA
jgi:hypothetical protein